MYFHAPCGVVLYSVMFCLYIVECNLNVIVIFMSIEKKIPVHSIMIVTPLFSGLPLLLLHSTIPSDIVFTKLSPLSLSLHDQTTLASFFSPLLAYLRYFQLLIQHASLLLRLTEEFTSSLLLHVKKLDRRCMHLHVFQVTWMLRS